MVRTPASAQDSKFKATIDMILGEEGHLRRFARRLVRCDSDVDDLVQETLLRAYCARDRFEPGTSVRAWTTTILRRLFLTGAIRAARRGVATETDSNDDLDFAAARTASWSPAGTGSDSVNGFSDELKAALERVPDVYRTAFCMSAMDDYSCTEIATMLNVPKGTVMSRIHRARESIRQDLLEAFRTKSGPSTTLPHPIGGFAPRSNGARRLRQIAG